jgi:uncharacterized UPF0146 family protein
LLHAEGKIVVVIIVLFGAVCSLLPKRSVVIIRVDVDIFDSRDSVRILFDGVVAAVSETVSFIFSVRCNHTTVPNFYKILGMGMDMKPIPIPIPNTHLFLGMKLILIPKYLNKDGYILRDLLDPLSK